MNLKAGGENTAPDFQRCAALTRWRPALPAIYEGPPGTAVPTEDKANLRP
jgi:hypothetical protein